MILLSFDIEEFDVPKEHGIDITIDQQIRISEEGTYKILDCLQQHEIKATFFCTATFALHVPKVMKRILAEGHELASHGLSHWTFQIEDLKKSKEILEQISGVAVNGYRQPRMMPVSEQAIHDAGYTYNSSLNPTIIPGRYMNISVPRTYFVKEGVVQFPASVTPWVRFPLFWLSYHHLPAALYRWLCNYTYRHDGYLVIYFHPWEFYSLAEHPEFKLPYVVRRNSGKEMVDRLNAFICYFKQRGVEFGRFMDYIRRNRISANQS